MSADGPNDDTIRELYCAAMAASEAMAGIMGDKLTCWCSDDIADPLLELIFALEEFERASPAVVQRTRYAVIRR